MLTWSARRRLLFLIIVVVMLIFAGTIVFLLNQPLPSCTDGKRNQDETGVDCGGVCAQVCPKEIEPIKVLWTRLFEVAPGKYDVAAYVENPNLRHSAGEIKYIIKVWDDQNLLINTRRGEAFLNPGEKFVLFESRIDVGERSPSRPLIELIDQPLWQRVTTEPPVIEFTKKPFVNDPNPKFAADITNRTLTRLENFEIVAVLSNAEENAIAVSSTVVDSLDKDETKEIVFTWPQPFPETPIFFDLYPHFDLRKLP